MKKLLLALMLQGIFLSTYAQEEPFIKSLRKLEYGSTILDAAMLFKKDFSQFRFLTEEPVIVADMVDPNNPENSKEIEAFYLVSDERNQLVQLYYVEDRLYQKAAYWYYKPGKVKEVEEKYAACKAYFEKDPVFIKANKGFLESEEIVSDRGRKMEYYFKNTDPSILRGECGYELVYSEKGGPKGFWVFMEGWNAEQFELSPDLKLLEIEPPKGTLENIDEVLLVEKP